MGIIYHAHAYRQKWVFCMVCEIQEAGNAHNQRKGTATTTFVNVPTSAIAPYFLIWVFFFKKITKVEEVTAATFTATSSLIFFLTKSHLWKNKMSSEQEVCVKGKFFEKQRRFWKRAWKKERRFKEHGE